MPLKLLEAYYGPVEVALRQYLWDIAYAPIITAINEDAPPLTNSRDALLQALRAGSISYADGTFTGRFTAQISGALRQFATFDRRQKAWVVKDVAAIPSTVVGAAVAARDRAVRLTRTIERSVETLERRITETIGALGFPIDAPLFAMDQELRRDVGDLTVVPEISPRMAEELVRDYTTNQQLNIKTWAPEQVERLRGIVQRHVKQGYRRADLMAMIEREWEVTSNKAKFLARQETGLFLAKLRRERFKDAGIQKYRWSTSSDERVRDRHAPLHGKVFIFGQPPVTDDRGNRNEPGEDYNCRCVAIPVLE